MSVLGLFDSLPLPIQACMVHYFNDHILHTVHARTKSTSSLYMLNQLLDYVCVCCSLGSLYYTPERNLSRIISIVTVGGISYATPGLRILPYHQINSKCAD